MTRTYGSEGAPARQRAGATRQRRRTGQDPTTHRRGLLAPLQGLADFAIVRSYVSTAAKWGITSLDAFEQLFTTAPGSPQPPHPAE